MRPCEGRVCQQDAAEDGARDRPMANRPMSRQSSSSRLSQTRGPLLDSWVTESIAIAVRGPNIAPRIRQRSGSRRGRAPPTADRHSQARVSDQFGGRGELNNVGAVDPDDGAGPETMVTLVVAGHAPQQPPGPASAMAAPAPKRPIRLVCEVPVFILSSEQGGGRCPRWGRTARARRGRPEGWWSIS